MTERPERKRSRSIRRSPFLELWEHDVATGGGERTVVTLELRDWVVIAARDTSGRWILVEQHRHGVDGLTLEPAGGIVDEGEEPGLAASRELLEETGYGGGAPRSLGSCHPNPALSANRAHFFLIDGARKECEPACPPDELTHVVLLGDEDLDVALAQGRITHALAEIALTRARRETSAVLARLA